MKVLDEGHNYLLNNLDGLQSQQILTFVKRCDLENTKKFPGNFNSYPGTTLQNVIRALLNRMRYLQNQIYAPENSLIIFFLKSSLWLLEFRAARRHKRNYFKSLKFAEFSPMCPKCGHTNCNHNEIS